MQSLRETQKCFKCTPFVRLRLSHEVLENVMLIKSNDENWTERERAEIMKNALDLYLQKSRKRKLDEPSRSVPDAHENNDNSDSDCNSDNCCEDSSESDSF